MTDKYPRIYTLRAYDREKRKLPSLPKGCEHHWTVIVEWTATSEEEFCGDSWCSGACGLPAAVLAATASQREMKLYSDMVAAGPLMQPWRLTWQGERRVIPEEHREDFLKRWWW